MNNSRYDSKARTRTPSLTPNLAPNLTRGVTLIELIIVLAFLAIILSLAVPSLETAGARADVKKGTQNITNALRMAKNTARVTNSRVTVTFDTDSETADISFNHSTSLTGADDLNISNMDVPENLTVTVANAAESKSFTFDPMGMVLDNNTGTILVRSSVNSDVASTVSIINAMGNLSVVDGAPEQDEEEI